MIEKALTESPDRSTDPSPSTAGNLLPLLEAIRAHGLVILAGAGISMLAPTSLPGWRDFNRAVLEALAARLGRDTNPPFVQKRLETLLARREVERAYAPDFMAQLMEEEVGADYFRVLEALDADVCNRNHDTIAALARDGHVKAIVTTNFDRLLEHALAARGVPCRIFASARDFDELAAALADDRAPLPVIKAHGSVERPDTMVDTLAQRVRGRPQALNAAVKLLLERHACLAIGFSGADLDYDPDYLGLRSAAASARGFVALTRTGAEPLPAMRNLVTAFGNRGGMHEGTLPEVLVALATGLGTTAPIAETAPPGTDVLAPMVNWQARLAERTAAWIDSLGTMPALTMFIALVDANGDDPWMLDFLLYFRRHYRTEEHTVDPWSGTPAYWRYEYQFGRRLLDRGRLTPDQHDRDDGQRLLSSRVISFRRHEDALNLLGNAATRGNLIEAQVALSETVFWVHGPGRAVAHAAQSWKRVAEATGYRHGVDAMITISRVFEWSGEYPLAAHASTAGVIDARNLGDEPRRAAAQVQYARALACVSRYDEADASLGESEDVVSRLSLATLAADVDAARGMIDVMRSRDQQATEPLQAACAHYRRTERLPRLFITLLDLARAAYYTGDNALLEQGQIELHALGDLFPRAEGLILLLQIELTLHQQAWDLAGQLVDALERFATADAEYPWRWGLGRVERYRSRLAGAK